MLLLHYDACATVINGTAQTPKDVTQNPEIRSMLEGESDSLSTKMSSHTLGVLFFIYSYKLMIQRLTYMFLHYFPCFLGHQRPREQRRGNWRRSSWKRHEKETFQL